MASVRYVPRSENRSHGSALGIKLRRFCDGQKKSCTTRIAGHARSLIAVHGALQRFVPVLKQRGARVRVVPHGSAGEKVGLDDYLASIGTPSELLELAEEKLRPLPATAEPVTYEASPGGLVWNRMTRDDPTSTPLTNFGAEIVADVERDTGAERQRFFEIEAQVHRRSTHFRIAASEYAEMRWVTERIGADAVVAPGWANREHARAAIQLLSKLRAW